MANPADDGEVADMKVGLVLVVPWWWCDDDVVGVVTTADDGDEALLLPPPPPPLLLLLVADSREWAIEFSAITWCNRLLWWWWGWWCWPADEIPTPARSPNTRWVPIERPIGSKERMAASFLLCPWLSCLRHFALRFWNQTYWNIKFFIQFK